MAEETFSLAQAVFEFGASKDDANLVESSSTVFSHSNFMKGVQPDLASIKPPSLSFLEKILKEASGAEKAEIDFERCTFRFHFGRGIYAGPPWAMSQPFPPHASQDARKRNGHSLPAGFVTAVLSGGLEEARLERTHSAASLVWNQYMRRTFDAAVAEEKVRLFGRIGSATSDIERLPTDLWPLLEVQDWAHGRAVDPTGNAYWSIRATQAYSDPVETTSPEKSSAFSRERAAMAIAELFPTTLPSATELPNKLLTTKVANWLKENGLPAVGADTVLRAAGRRRK
jgi:hypothetical protein